METVINGRPAYRQPGRPPGIYDAQGRPLTRADIMASRLRSRPAVVDEAPWLQPPRWWSRVRPLRWIALFAALSLLVQNCPPLQEMNLSALLQLMGVG